jgi:hypothetical protein
VAVPGSLRLAIELVVLGVGAAGFATGGLPWPGLVLAALVVVHYVTSRPRVRWLLTVAG